MSTVVITPTHIASDHTVNHDCFPHESRVDLSYRKIFLDPEKRFLFGTVGEFIPTQIDTPEIFKSLTTVLIEMLANHMTVGTELYLLDWAKPSLEKLDKVLDRGGKSFIVTRDYRFLLVHSKKHNVWIAKRCGDYAGIGSGGMIATGMLIGGMPLEKIWQPLHDLDYHTSVEHTSIPLSVLKPLRLKS